MDMAGAFRFSHCFFSGNDGRNVRDPAPPLSRALPVLAIVICALSLFPIRFVAEANPDWRLLSWTLALAAVGISLATMFLLGGNTMASVFLFPDSVLFWSRSRGLPRRNKS